MNELMFQAGVKGMSERSELIPCTNYVDYYSGGFRGGKGGANEPPFEADNSDFAVKVF